MASTILDIIFRERKGKRESCFLHDGGDVSVYSVEGDLLNLFLQEKNGFRMPLNDTNVCYQRLYGNTDFLVKHSIVDKATNKEMYTFRCDIESGTIFYKASCVRSFINKKGKDADAKTLFFSGGAGEERLERVVSKDSHIHQFYNGKRGEERLVSISDKWLEVQHVYKGERGKERLVKTIAKTHVWFYFGEKGKEQISSFRINSTNTTVDAKSGPEFEDAFTESTNMLAQLTLGLPLPFTIPQQVFATGNAKKRADDTALALIAEEEEEKKREKEKRNRRSRKKKEKRDRRRQEEETKEEETKEEETKEEETKEEEEEVLGCQEEEEDVSGFEDECVICLSGEKTHAVVPCGHQCICYSCSSVVQKCPICRTPSSMTMRVFLS